MAYRPGPLPILAGIPSELDRYLREELENIASEFFQLGAYSLALQAQSAEPKTPADGTLVYSDGVQWNPGGGAGLYVYFGGAWRQVSVV